LCLNQCTLYTDEWMNNKNYLNYTTIRIDGWGSTFTEMVYTKQNPYNTEKYICIIYKRYSFYFLFPSYYSTQYYSHDWQESLFLQYGRDNYCSVDIQLYRLDNARLYNINDIWWFDSSVSCFYGLAADRPPFSDPLFSDPIFSFYFYKLYFWT